MAVNVTDIMGAAARLLLDEDHDRWTLEALADYINEAMQAIALAKPDSFVTQTTIPLVAGTFQSLPANVVAFLGRARDGTMGRAVTPIEREQMDSLVREWGNPAVLPYGKTPTHIITDAGDPRTFHIVPGNDGTGSIVARCAVLPPTLATATDPDLITSWNIVIPLLPIYSPALIDYTVFRALSIEWNSPAGVARADAHLRLFQTALGIRAESEVASAAAADGIASQTGSST